MPKPNNLVVDNEQVYIGYQCSCTTPEGVFGSKSPPKFPRRPLGSSAMVSSLTQAIENFYFCEKCYLAKCHRCIMEDVLFHFCPHCQFEVQGPINLADKMKCWRNCLLCPECTSNLILMEEVSPRVSQRPERNNSVSYDVVSEPFMISTDSGGEPSARKFHYFCFACKYDSREQGLVFDKTLFLAGVVAELEKAQVTAIKELKQLQLHYDIEYMVPHFVLSNSALKGIEALEGFEIRLSDLFKMRGRPYNSLFEEQLKQKPELKEELQKLDREKIAQLLSLTGISETSSFQTLLQHGTNLKNPTSRLGFPQRQPLRSRRIKSCLTCQTELARPSPKVSHSHRFAFKCPGSNYIPVVEVFELPALVAGSALTVGLRFNNPLCYKVFIKLSSPIAPNWFLPYESNQPGDTTNVAITSGLSPDPDQRFPPELNHYLELPTPKFSVEAYKDDWELDENQASKQKDSYLDDFDLEAEEEDQAVKAGSVRSGLSHASQGPLRFDPSNPYKAVVDRHNNETSILVTVTPRGDSGTEVILPILMAFTTRVSKDDENNGLKSLVNTRPISPVSGGVNKSSDSTLFPLKSSGNVSKSDSGREYHTRYSWIYIKLGTIV